MLAETWDRQSGEPENCYRAFCTYRDMGAGRTVPAAFRQQSGNNQATQAAGAWNRWSARYEWKPRALDYDRHLGSAARRGIDRATEDAAAKWARRRDSQAEADWLFSQKYASEVGRLLHRPDGLLLLDARQLKDAIAVTAAASALAWAAIHEALPDPDDNIDFDAATTEELRAHLARVEARFAPRIARTG